MANVQAQGALSDEHYRLLVESVTDYAIYMLDPAGRVVTWNAGAERIKGYTAQEIIGQSFGVFFPPEDVDRGKPERELALALELGRYEDEGWRVRKDGSRFWAYVVLTCLRDEKGAIRGFAKVTRDLTERYRAEEERRLASIKEAQLASLRLVIDNLPELAWTALPDGHIDFYNQPWFDYTGATFAEMEGWGWEAVHDPAVLPEVTARWRRSLATGEPFEMEFPLRRADGSFQWFLTRVRPLRSDDGAIVRWVGINTNIDDRKRAEEALQAAGRAKDEFLAVVSHELRTPLSAILGWASMLSMKTLDATVAKPIEVIHRNALAQIKIVDDLLDVSRVITGKLRVDPKPVDLLALARDAVQVVRPSADAKGILVELRSERDPWMLTVDPDRIQQAIWNLLSNAVKFTDAGGTIRVEIYPDGANVSISVTDSGKGIAPAFRPFVFDRFRQEDASLTRQLGGLGLGLALVRHIVELHGGQVTAASPGLGKGSTFTMTLPERAVVLQARPPASSSRRVDATTDARSTIRGVRVLVVEDDADARELLKIVLEEHGASVHTAGSAAEGFRWLKEFRPDVLVSDIAMPIEDGYSFLRRVRALTASEGGAIPAVALTACAREEERMKALAVGYTTHIAKPVTPEVLATVVGNLVSVLR